MFSLLDSNMEGIHRISRTGREKGEGEIGVEERGEKQASFPSPSFWGPHSIASFKSLISDESMRQASMPSTWFPLH